MQPTLPYKHIGGKSSRMESVMSLAACDGPCGCSPMPFFHKFMRLSNIPELERTQLLEELINCIFYLYSDPFLICIYFTKIVGTMRKDPCHNSPSEHQCISLQASLFSTMLDPNFRLLLSEHDLNITDNENNTLTLLHLHGLYS